MSCSRRRSSSISASSDFRAEVAEDEASAAETTRGFSNEEKLVEEREEGE